MEIPFRPLGEFENKYSSRQTFADYDFDVLTAGLSVAICKFLWWKCSDTLRRFDFEWSACLRFSQELNDIDVLPRQQALDSVRQRFWQAQFKQRSFAHTTHTADEHVLTRDNEDENFRATRNEKVFWWDVSQEKWCKARNVFAQDMRIIIYICLRRAFA